MGKSYAFMFLISMYCQRGGIGYPRSQTRKPGRPTRLLQDNNFFLVFADEHETLQLMCSAVLCIGYVGEMLESMVELTGVADTP